MKGKFTFALLFVGITVWGQINKDSLYMRQNYDKFEYQIAMRDGIKLFTIVYVPKDQSKKYPILLNRTCYNASNYANWDTNSHPSKYLVQDKYILAFQDVRGRYMSEGTFDNMRPNIPGNDKKIKQPLTKVRIPGIPLTG